ncbi:MAG UNVERIFIED_CONTAM: SH3 domain-containing protein [Anaerolineae bacterium]
MVKKFFIGLLCLIWVTSVGAQAPTVAIDSPHTVSLLRGLISVEGTVDVPELQLFWLQVRALNETLEPIVNGSGRWMPITLPQSGVIVNGVLGQWDTMRVEDGLYELQLIAFPVSGVPVLDTLSPLRVENEKVAYVGGQYFNESILLTGDSPSTDASGAILTAPTVAPLVVVAPTVAPLVVVAPTVATGGSCNPTATAAVNANVRTGDSTAYSVVGTLPRGQQAPIIGRSSRSAWYVIRLSNGTQGFISPTTISIVGDVTCAPLTEPPALAFTSTPFPQVPRLRPPW